MRIAVTLLGEDLDKILRKELNAMFPGYVCEGINIYGPHTVYLSPEPTPDEPLPFLKEAA